MLISNTPVSERCVTCGNFIDFSYTLNNTAAPTLCTCPKPVSSLETLAWECPRCKKINAPWNKSCDCAPPSNNSFNYYTGIVNANYSNDITDPFSPRTPNI